MVTTAEKTAQTLTGKVISNKMDKTITVLVERTVIHSKYKKHIKRTTKIHAHDPDNVCGEGDVVLITSSKPISKTKAWKLVEILEKQA